GWDDKTSRCRGAARRLGLPGRGTTWWRRPALARWGTATGAGRRTGRGAGTGSRFRAAEVRWEALALGLGGWGEEAFLQKGKGIKHFRKIDRLVVIRIGSANDMQGRFAWRDKSVAIAIKPLEVFLDGLAAKVFQPQR